MAIVLVLAGAIVAQVKPFIPVEGASLKAKIDNAYIGNLRIAQVQFLHRAYATPVLRGETIHRSSAW